MTHPEHCEPGLVAAFARQLPEAVAQADAIIAVSEHTRAELVERLGVGYDVVSKVNPRLIYCSLTGYGVDGPYRDVKAYDLLIQGEAGIIATTGYPDAPAKVGIPMTDIAAGMYAALGIAFLIGLLAFVWGLVFLGLAFVVWRAGKRQVPGTPSSATI